VLALMLLIFPVSLIVFIGSLTPEYNGAKVSNLSVFISGVSFCFVSISGGYLGWELFKLLVRLAL
jgi:hypothetical protein